MKFELIKDEDLSGTECSFYNVYIDGEESSLYDKFIIDNEKESEEEISELDDRLYVMGHELGARSIFFKEHEGFADLVCALYDKPNAKLRLYCIKYGMDLVVLGGGGVKNVRAYQDDPKLHEEVVKIMDVANSIHEKQQNGELEFSKDFKDFIGDLIFNSNEEE